MPCTCAVTDIAQSSRKVARAITFFAHFALAHVTAQGTRQCSCEMAYPCKLLALHTQQLFLQAQSSPLVGYGEGDRQVLQLTWKHPFHFR